MEGIPNKQPSLATPIVPEYNISSDKLESLLIPDTIKSGYSSGVNICLSPNVTLSTGEPPTA